MQRGEGLSPTTWESDEFSNPIEYVDDPDWYDQAGEAVQIHGGWWCYEHGVPEEQCAMCDIKLAAELREKGDWCDEHNRPDSLCFQCHPENAEKFAALYEAKYGKKPPKPEG